MSMVTLDVETYGKMMLDAKKWELVRGYMFGDASLDYTGRRLRTFELPAEAMRTIEPEMYAEVLNDLITDKEMAENDAV